MKGIRAKTLLLACITTAGLFFGSAALPYTYVSADESLTAYEKTDIADDLRDIDVALYPANSEGKHRLIDEIGFTEYSYSTNALLKDYYGIYFYVYNPTEKAIVERKGANVANMAVAYNAEGAPSSYENVELKLLSETENHRFLKFGLKDQSAAYERARAYADKHGGTRRYDIAGIQLWFEGDRNATDANTERDDTSYTYLCMGYAKGCGANSTSESTLQVRREELRTLQLDVHHTYYRPDGTNGKTQFTHDSLNSIYFSVPKEIIKAYGEMSGIKGQYLRALTSDIFVTGNEKYYQLLQPLVGRDVGYYSEGDDFNFGIMSNDRRALGVFGTSWGYHVSQEFADKYNGGVWFNQLNYLFKATNGDADTYNVPSTALMDYMTNYTNANKVDAGKLVGGKFHPDLFAEVDPKITVFDFNTDSVTEAMQGQYITQNGWQRIWGTQSTSDFVFLEQKKVIDKVTDADFKTNVGTNELNKTAVSDGLYVAETDVQELYDYYEANKEESDVYLIRFAVDDYVSAEAVEGRYYEGFLKDFEEWLTHRDIELAFKNKTVDTNCYLAQEYVYLNFEIIETRFTKQGRETVIPVVMSPIDIIPDVTHPSQTMRDRNWALVVWLCGIALGVSVIGVAAYFIQKHNKA